MRISSVFMVNQSSFFLMLILLVMLNLACSVQVNIVLNPKLLPYYEWLISFPALKFYPPQPTAPVPVEEQGYPPVTRFDRTETGELLPGDIIVLT